MAIFLRVAPSARYRLEGATREHETFQTPIFSTRYTGALMYEQHRARTKIDHTRGESTIELTCKHGPHLQPPVPVLFIHLTHGITG